MGFRATGNIDCGHCGEIILAGESADTCASCGEVICRERGDCVPCPNDQEGG